MNATNKLIDNHIRNCCPGSGDNSIRQTELCLVLFVIPMWCLALCQWLSIRLLK